MNSDKLKELREALRRIKGLITEDAGRGDALCYEIYILICEELKEAHNE